VNSFGWCSAISATMPSPEGDRERMRRPCAHEPLQCEPSMKAAVQLRYDAGSITRTKTRATGAAMTVEN